jgi:hypothetical protein
VKARERLKGRETREGEREGRGREGKGHREGRDRKVGEGKGAGADGIAGGQNVSTPQHKLLVAPLPHIDPLSYPANLSNCQPVTLDEVYKLLSQSPATNCYLDPIPTSFLKQWVPVLLPAITSIINFSLSSGISPAVPTCKTKLK